MKLTKKVVNMTCSNNEVKFRKNDGELFRRVYDNDKVSNSRHDGFEFAGSDFSDGFFEVFIAVDSDLSCCNFNGADFSHAILKDSKINDSTFIECDFSSADLTGVEGLDTCDFSGAIFDEYTKFTATPENSAVLRNYNVFEGCLGHGNETKRSPKVLWWTSVAFIAFIVLVILNS